MPIYTYQCKNCGQETDELIERNNKDNPGISCDNCGSEEFKRMISAPSQIDNKMSNHSNQYSCSGGSCGI